MSCAETEKDQFLYDRIIKHFTAFKLHKKRSHSSKRPLYYLLDNCLFAEDPAKLLYKFGVVFPNEKHIAIKAKTLATLFGTNKTSIYPTLNKLFKRVSLDSVTFPVELENRLCWTLYDISDNSHLTELIEEYPYVVATKEIKRKDFTADEDFTDIIQFFMPKIPVSS